MVKILKIERAVVKITSQKPYSPSPGAGSLRTMIPEACFPDRSQMHVDECDEEVLAAQQRMR
jgi:hypothetical protein